MDLKKFDLEETMKVIERSKERSANEVEIERFTRSFFGLYGGKIEPTRKKSVWRFIPPKQILREGITDKYGAITFSKEVAKDLGEGVEFLAFGHPLLDAMIDYCRDKNYLFGGRAAVKCNESFKETGVLFNFLLRFDDATGKTINEEILPLFISPNKSVEFPSPRTIAGFNNESPDITSNEIKKLNNNITDLYQKAHEIALQSKDFVPCSKKKGREFL
jgi:hypothetical protein